MRNLISILSILLFACIREGIEKEAQYSLRVVSYNIHHGEGMDGKIELQRIADVIAKQKPDLVALQEVDKNCTRSKGLDIARELGKLLGMEYCFGKFMNFQGGEYGMAILSRLPIRETACHPLPTGAEPRCALEVQVELEGFSQPVSFVCIHNDWTSEEIRLKQIQALSEILQKRNNPMILAGDFNGERNDKYLELLKIRQWEILDKGGQKTWPADKPNIEIDFIAIKNFYQPVSENRVINELQASDHRPIQSVITFSGDAKRTR